MMKLMFQYVLIFIPLSHSPAVLCGAPGGDLEAASLSVAAARGIVEALFTAPLPRLVTPDEMSAADEDEEGSLHIPRRT